MRRPWRNTAITLFLCTLLLGTLFGSRLQALDGDTRESMRLYTELLSAAHENYGAEVDYKDLVYASIGGVTRALDPHTYFLPPQAYDGMRERQQSSFYGLGILVGQRNGRVTVITPIEGGPASRLGVQAGDIIDSIDGESTEPLSLDDAVRKLKGPKGSTVTITLLRRGLEKPLEMKVVRAEIPLTTVRYSYMLTPETAYMRITDFNRGTGEEVATEMARLKEQGMKRLLLDLRNNGGGLLDQAIEVGEQFVPKGSRIVETRGRTRSSHQTFYGNGDDKGLNLPVVVLVNSGTASAAEILAGAIQDHDIGVIAGTPTWGKGLVQTVYSLSYGAGLALTTAKYYTPSGRLIQRDYSSYFDYYAYDPLGGSPELSQAQGEEEVGVEPRPGESFHTDLGRSVYGGGGISPDVVVPSNQISSFLQLLHTRNAFFDFAVDYQRRNPAVREQSWTPTKEVLDEFGRWLEKEDLGSAEEMRTAFAEEETATYALRQIRAEVFNAAFGQEAWHRVLAAGDPQIEAALGLFDRAAELLANRKNLEDPQRAALEKGDMGKGGQGI